MGLVEQYDRSARIDVERRRPGRREIAPLFETRIVRPCTPCGARDALVGPRRLVEPMLSEVDLDRPLERKASMRRHRAARRKRHHRCARRCLDLGVVAEASSRPCDGLGNPSTEPTSRRANSLQRELEELTLRPSSKENPAFDGARRLGVLHLRIDADRVVVEVDLLPWSCQQTAASVWRRAAGWSIQLRVGRLPSQQRRSSSLPPAQRRGVLRSGRAFCRKRSEVRPSHSPWLSGATTLAGMAEERQWPMRDSARNRRSLARSQPRVGTRPSSRCSRRARFATRSRIR